MSRQSLVKADLMQFTGSERRYRHRVVRKVSYTEGVQYLADHANAYWLIDEIIFGQCAPAVVAQKFQHWKLMVDLEKQRALLTCDDGSGQFVFGKEIKYTDFPLDEIRFYFIDNIILLPSEY